MSSVRRKGAVLTLALGTALPQLQAGGTEPLQASPSPTAGTCKNPLTDKRVPGKVIRATERTERRDPKKPEWDLDLDCQQTMAAMPSRNSRHGHLVKVVWQERQVVQGPVTPDLGQPDKQSGMILEEYQIGDEKVSTPGKLRYQLTRAEDFAVPIGTGVVVVRLVPYAGVVIAAADGAALLRVLIKGGDPTHTLGNALGRGYGWAARKLTDKVFRGDGIKEQALNAKAEKRNEKWLNTPPKRPEPKSRK